jgi:Tfp pilus assembly protein PilO
MKTRVLPLAARLRRNPFCAVCLVIALACGPVAWFLHGTVTELGVQHQARSKEWEAMLTLLVGGSAQRQEVTAVREATRRIEDNLVVEANLAENLWYFYKLEEQTKARLPELHQLNASIGDRSATYTRVPYSLRVAGSFDQVAAFLGNLEMGPRIANITAFNFARSGANADTHVLDLNLELLGKR